MTTSPSTKSNGNTTRGARNFPRKLLEMLQDADAKGFSDVVAWQPSGNSFKVLKPKKFEATIMRNYFNQTKYKSFQRQLNIYGFLRIHYGPNKGGYEHPCLSKNSPDLCQLIARQVPASETLSSHHTNSSNKSSSSSHSSPLPVRTRHSTLDSPKTGVFPSSAPRVTFINA